LDKVEIRVPTNINFDWTHDNLKKGRALGRAAVTELLNFHYFLQHYLNNEIEPAAECAKKLPDDDPLGLVAKAVTYRRTGRMGKAREAVDLLCATDKAWCRYPRLELGKTIHTPATLDRLMEDLRGAGLQCTTANVTEESQSNHLVTAVQARS
jgi:hypothetical protein